MTIFLKKGIFSSLMAVAVALYAMTVSALPYFSAETTANTESAATMSEYYYGGVKAIDVASGHTNDAKGPAGNSIISSWKAISRIYTLNCFNGENLGLYHLPMAGRGVGAYTRDHSPETKTLLQAQTAALQINVVDHTIPWSDVTSVNIRKSLNISSRSGLVMASIYTFTSFIFESLRAEMAWLSGDAGMAYDLRDYPKSVDGMR